MLRLVYNTLVCMFLNNHCRNKCYLNEELKWHNFCNPSSTLSWLEFEDHCFLKLCFTVLLTPCSNYLMNFQSPFAAWRQGFCLIYVCISDFRHPVLLLHSYPSLDQYTASQGNFLIHIAQCRLHGRCTEWILYIPANISLPLLIYSVYKGPN